MVKKVDKKWVAISYCLAFISVYGLQIVYAMSIDYINNNYNANIPQSATLNNTTNAISSLSDWTNIPIIVIITTIALIILTIITGSFGAMRKAY